MFVVKNPRSKEQRAKEKAERAERREKKLLEKLE